MSDLVGNPEDRFSHVAAPVMLRIGISEKTRLPRIYNQNVLLNYFPDQYSFSTETQIQGLTETTCYGFLRSLRKHAHAI